MSCPGSGGGREAPALTTDPSKAQESEASSSSADGKAGRVTNEDWSKVYLRSS